MAMAFTNYISNAHRLPGDVADTVKEVQPGQLFQFNANGELEYADGTKRAYPTLNSRYSGQGYGQQGERLEGRDDVSLTGKISVLAGNYEIGTDQYDSTKTFEYGAPVKAAADGQVVPFESASDNAAFILGFVTYVPADDTEMLRYQG